MFIFSGMTKPLESLNDAGRIIRALGGPAKLAKLLGVSTQTAFNMGARGSFPPGHWATLIRLAAVAKVPGVTLDSLIAMSNAAKKKNKRSANQHQALTE